MQSESRCYQLVAFTACTWSTKDMKNSRCVNHRVKESSNPANIQLAQMLKAQDDLQNDFLAIKCYSMKCYSKHSRKVIYSLVFKNVQKYLRYLQSFIYPNIFPFSTVSPHLSKTSVDFEDSEISSAYTYKRNNHLYPLAKGHQRSH